MTYFVHLEWEWVCLFSIQEKEEEDYLEWLKGQKEEVTTDKNIVAELVSDK